jgi:hypothetical protein
MTVMMTTAGPAPDSGSSSTTAMRGLSHARLSANNHQRELAEPF